MSIIYINEQGAYLRKRSGCFVVTKKDEEIFSVPEASVDEVVILGNVQISTQAISELLAKGIEVLFLSMNGKFKGMLEPGYPKNVFMRMAQYEAATEPITQLALATWVVRNKLNGELIALHRWQRNHWLDATDNVITEIGNIVLNLDNKYGIDELRGAEALAAKLYFSVMPDLLPPPFEWQGRNRRPPRDPVNALFSLTYMMTLGQVISACYAHALDPYIGFMHQLDYSRPSFALDVLELCRSHYCDHFVVAMLQRELFELGDFSYSEENGCRLSNDAFKLYLDNFHNLRTAPGRNPVSMQKFITNIMQSITASFKKQPISDLVSEI